MKKIFSCLVVLLILISAGFSQTESAAVAQVSHQQNDVSATQYAQRVLVLVNYERHKANLPALTLSTDLTQATMVRANEITKRFAHTRPNGQSCFTVIKNKGRILGENIAAGQRSPEEVVIAWMNSKGHRENILNPKFKEMGLGYLLRPSLKYKHYWAQFFRG